MLPTVTIESTRIFSTFDMEALLGGLIAIASLAWMAMTRRRHHRHR
jgi:hypothetical protein